MVEAPTPPLAPVIAMMRPTGFASCVENRLQIARTTSIGVNRRDHIVAHAASHQLAIEQDIVRPADDDNPRSRVADRGKVIKAGQDVAASFALEDDDVRRRRIAIGFDRSRHAAHLDLQVGLAEPAILAGCLHGGGGLDRFAERLNGNARRRSDVLVLRCRYACCFGFGILLRVVDHLPTSLILPLSCIRILGRGWFALSSICRALWCAAW